MNTKDAIRERRTIHNFNSLIVPDQIIENAIKAANYAPCHKLTFPWRFYLINNKLRSIILNQYLINNNFTKEKQERLKKRFLTPSNLIIATQNLSVSLEIQKEDYAACSCAIQNLMLSLTSDGVGSKWGTGKIINDEDIHKLIGIASTKEIIIGFIWIGYGEKPSNIKRPPLDKIFMRR